MKKIFTLLFFAILGLNNTNAATFSSVASGTWSAPATWAVVGADADGIPDNDDDMTINSGHTVILTSVSYCKTILIQAGASLDANSQKLATKGNFTNLGTIIGVMTYYSQASGTFKSSSTITNNGDWYVQAGTLTIDATTVLNKGNYINVLSGASVVNNGNVTLLGSSLNLSGAGVQWTNASNSSLEVQRNIVGTGNILATAVPNTVTYNSSNVTTIKMMSYYNLSIKNGLTRTLTSPMVIANDLLLAGTSNKLDLSGNSLTIGGSYTNSTGFSLLNQGTVTFNGTSTQTITGTTNPETINNMVVNCTGTVLLGKPITTQNLTITNGTLDVSASNYSVNVSGNLMNNGSINTRSGLFTFNGTTAQTISGSSNTQFYDIRIANLAGVTASSAQSITDALTLASGNFNAASAVTLVSNSSKTARIAPIVSGSVSGNFIIQKHISARAANYHDLSSPVTSTTIMDWDDDLYMSGIGADDGTPGPAGVDGGAGGDSSVWSYNEPTASYIAVTGSNYSVVSGKAYEIFIADDLTSWAARTIDTKGTPTVGNKVVGLSYSAGAGAYAGVNLVGNPYASSVNYASCTKSNITGNVLILDNTGNYTDYGASPVIPPHQGFWITASGVGASITFLESAKSSATATSFYKKASHYGIKLVFSSPMLPFYNENTINFETNSSTDYDLDKDALYLKSPNKNAPAMFMYTQTDAKLITNTINTDESEVTIPLGIYTPKEGVYYIAPSVMNTSSYNYAWIENIKTGIKYELTSTIAFNGTENETNHDYVLRLSKSSKSSELSASSFENDINVFNSENTINLKSYNTNHDLSQVAVYDLSGKMVLEVDNLYLEAGKISEIDISSLSRGVYIVKVTSSSNQTISKKIIR